MYIEGQLIDLHKQRIYPARILVQQGKIISIEEDATIKDKNYILPGFIDAHVHVESSMLIPSEFARLAVVHGTVGTVSDPHEIANVLGIEGVRYMLQNGKKVLFHFCFGAPSCVPATPFETAGAVIGCEEIETLFDQDGLTYLSEMMNYPGVLHRDALVMDKIAVAKKRNLPVDGHSPGLKGDDAKRYIDAGISTDHECFTLDEALEKIKRGMKIIIREGSAAKNYEALHSLLKTDPSVVMFGSDDKHPNDLVKGHINELVSRSLKKGYDLFAILKAASQHPVDHYKLPIGLLRTGDSADFIVVEDLETMIPIKTFIKGELVAEKGKPLLPSIKEEAPNQFNIHSIDEKELSHFLKPGNVHVIEAIDGELITKHLVMEAPLPPDVQKIVVVNRYVKAPLAIGFIKGFHLKKGALASSVAHDSHNVVAVGVDDTTLTEAINAVIAHRGGLSVTDGTIIKTLPLPVAGLMSADDGYKVGREYAEMDAFAKSLGTPLYAPFMTLSFMALLVIPSLKMSDQGLFDGKEFKFCKLQ